MTAMAMRINGPGAQLQAQRIAFGPPGEHQVLLRVCACGVCRTDLHVLDGELDMAQYPITPGHEIVGRVVAAGTAVTQFRIGDRVGVPWLGGSCGVCAWCRQGLENLCDNAVFTGATVDGGYAELVTADARYCLGIPEHYSDIEAAPLLCAGLIGYRAYLAAGDAKCVGLYGFGAAAHLLTQIAVYQGRRVCAFTRPGDVESQQFARTVGASWAGGSDAMPPQPLDAAILFAPAGELVPTALRAVRKAGRVVCAGIHMSDIPAFPYSLLWGERSVSSVANLTRRDGVEFMAIAARLPLQPVVESFALQDANLAIDRLRRGALQGAAVLVPESE
ncbi:MAG TPA: zinc-dependent alcohol dehydrogenase family protein [Steroidobacteraceae bacterium]|nr:zinc-dependent alcohol dehydrogenase family protein [Steroidobacteraceae bacterium]